MDIRYIVMEIGCLECGEPSTLVAVFSDKDKAHALARKLNEDDDCRDREYRTFEVPPPPFVHPHHAN